MTIMMFEKGSMHKQELSCIKKIPYIYCPQRNVIRGLAIIILYAHLLLEPHTYYCKDKHCHTSW